MRKFLIGVIAVVIVCVGGYFGTELYLRQRIAGEVDAAFAQMRANGAAATHGRLAFDLLSRTLTIADIAVKSDAQRPVDVKIGHFTAERVDLMQAGRFAADRVEIADIEVGGTLAMQGGRKIAYNVPRIEIAAYSGPSGPLRRFDPASPHDLWRFALEHFVAVTATSITVPAVTASMVPAASDAKGLGPAAYTYSGIAARDIREGRVASVTMDRFSYTTRAGVPGVAEELTGEIVTLTALDLDAAATLAMLDPAHAKDDTYHRAYRQLTSGAYTASLGSKMRMRIESMSADDIGVRPSKLQISDLLALADSMPANPSPTQLEQMLPRIAGLYEGIRIGRFEMRGLSFEAPDGAAKVGTMRLAGVENGRIGEFAFEGVDARTKSPFKVGRFALKALDVANLMRMSAQLSATATQKLAPGQFMELLRLLEGVEIKNLVSPYGSAGKTVNIETIDLAWGAYVGAVPSRLRATVKMSGPIGARDPEPFKMLAAAGFANASMSLDLGAAWDEGTRAITLAPGAAEIGNVGTLAARLTLANAPREMFSTDPFQIMVGAAVMEAGPVEIVLRDTGGIDLAVAQYARTQTVSRDAARKALIDNVRQTAAGMAALSADAMAVGGAIARFIETPRGTLTLRLTPKGKVSLMEIMEAGKANPFDALARFQVEAVAGR
jgi:hypothetical protein